MQTTSTEFKSTILKSHRMATKIELYSNNVLQNVTFYIERGTVTVDDVPVRRKVTLTLSDPTGTLTPSSASSLLAPLGNELKIYRGVYLPSTGLPEYIPLGVFGISDVKVYDSGNGLTLSVDAYDRARKVQRAKFLTEYVVAAGTNYGTAIRALISARYPAATFAFDAVSSTTPQLVFEAGSDPWKAAQDMAASCGCDLYFDASGVCTLRAVPIISSTTPINQSFAEGANCILLYANKRLNDETTYNHVVFTGENNGVATPVRGEAYDSNVNSPTYYLGPYGDVVYFAASSFMTSNAQCVAAAQARLQKVIGLIESMQLQTVPNPALDIDDVVEVIRVKSKVNAHYIIDKVTIPLGPDEAMQLACRQRVVQ